MMHQAHSSPVLVVLKQPLRIKDLLSQAPNDVLARIAALLHPRDR